MLIIPPPKTLIITFSPFMSYGTLMGSIKKSGYTDKASI